MQTDSLDEATAATEAAMPPSSHDLRTDGVSDKEIAELKVIIERLQEVRPQRNHEPIYSSNIFVGINGTPSIRSERALHGLQRTARQTQRNGRGPTAPSRGN